MNVPKTPAIVRIASRQSPIHGEDRGKYLQIAHPNNAIFAFGKYRPSFEKPYKLERDVLVVTQEDVDRVWPRWCANYDITVL